jgi:hypothetical protein
MQTVNSRTFLFFLFFFLIVNLNVVYASAIKDVSTLPPAFGVDQTARGQAEQSLNIDVAAVTAVQQEATKLTSGATLTAIPGIIHSLITLYKQSFPEQYDTHFINLSIQALGSMLGGVGGTLGEIYDTCPTPDAGSGAETQPEALTNCKVLPRLFYWFNWGLIGILGLILSYTALITTYDTLSEGVMFGQQGKPYFTMFRSFTGVAAVTPLPHGYSLLQMLVMWSVLQGVHLANLSWVLVKAMYYTNTNWIAPALMAKFEPPSVAGSGSSDKNPIVAGSGSADDPLVPNLTQKNSMMLLVKGMFLSEVCAIQNKAQNVVNKASSDSSAASCSKSENNTLLDNLDKPIWGDSSNPDFFSALWGKLAWAQSTATSQLEKYRTGDYIFHLAQYGGSVPQTIASCPSYKKSLTTPNCGLYSVSSKEVQLSQLAIYLRLMKAIQPSIHSYAQNLVNDMAQYRNTHVDPNLTPFFTLDKRDSIESQLSLYSSNFAHYFNVMNLSWALSYTKLSIAKTGSDSDTGTVQATSSMNPHIYMPGTDWTMFGPLYGELLKMVGSAYSTNGSISTAGKQDNQVGKNLYKDIGFSNTLSSGITNTILASSSEIGLSAYNPSTSCSSIKLSDTVSCLKGQLQNIDYTESSTTINPKPDDSDPTLETTNMPTKVMGLAGSLLSTMPSIGSPSSGGSDLSNMSSVITAQWTRGTKLTAALLCSRVPMSPLFLSISDHSGPAGCSSMYDWPVVLNMMFNQGAFYIIDPLGYNWGNPVFKTDSIFTTWQARIVQDYQVYLYQLITSWLYAFGSYKSSDYGVDKDGNDKLLAKHTAWLTDGSIGLKLEKPTDNPFNHINPILMMQHFGLALLFVTVNFYRSIAQDVMMANINAGAKYAYGMYMSKLIADNTSEVAKIVSMLSWALEPIVIVIPPGIPFPLGEWILWVICTLVQLVLRSVSAYFTVVASMQPLFLQLDMFLRMQYVPFAVAAAIPPMLLGLTLSIYVPMIPFLAYILSVLGWLLSVLEAIVAAPVIALGVTHPRGHDFLGRAEQAFILILSLFVKPIGIVIGFIFSVILVFVSFLIFHQMVDPFFFDLLTKFESQGSNFYNYFPFIFGLFVYVYAATTIVNLCFQLTYRLPNYLARWIGLSENILTSSSPEEELMQEIEGQVKGEANSSMGDIAASSVNKSFGFQLFELPGGKVGAGFYDLKSKGKKGDSKTSGSSGGK